MLLSDYMSTLRGNNTLSVSTKLNKAKAKALLSYKS